MILRAPSTRVATVGLLFLALSVGAGCVSLPLEERDWIEARTQHFRFLSELSPEETTTLAQELELFHSVITKVNDLNDFAAPVTTNIVVLTSGAYKQIAPRNTSGVFYPGPRTNWAIINGRSRGDDPEVVLRHEYVHYVLRNGSLIAYPTWYDEGFAEYLSTVRVRRGQVEIGRPPLGRLQNLEDFGTLPPERLFGENYADMSHVSTAVFYAQSWAMVHFMQFGVARGLPDRRAETREYLRQLTLGATWRAAFREAYRAEPEEVMSEFRRYMSKPLGYLPFPADRFPYDDDVRVRRLGRAEVARELGALVLRTGGAQRAEALFSAALEASPDDPRALCGLADARRFQQRYDDLDALYDRALELGRDDPLTQLDYAEHLVAKLRIEALEPGSGGFEETLRAARLHFEQAISLAPSLPEAHAELGYTYLLPGEDATRGIPHLERAFELLSSDGQITFALARASAARGSRQSREDARYLFGLTRARYHGNAQVEAKVAAELAKLDAAAPAGPEPRSADGD